MLDKLISQIKSSLPGGKKKSEEDENEDSLEPREEGEEEEESDASDSSSDDDEDDDGDVDKKLEASLEAKKKKTMIIRVVIGLGIGAYLAMPYIFPEKTEEVIPQVEVKKKNRKKPEDAVPTQDPAQNTTQSPDLNQANPPATNPTVENTQGTTPPPVEDVNITPKDSPDKTGTGLGESTQKENEISKTIDQMISPTDPISDTPKEEKPVDLKDKIVEEDPYVEPPNYELKGRGLVYNCTDKYWACVEKEAYQKCNKNLKYNKKHSKAVECAIVNVYGSAEDCVLVQKYNISSNAATDFCNGSN